MTTTQDIYGLYFRRSQSNWLAPHKTDRSLSYWRSCARKIFALYPRVETIEVVRSGRKSDSALAARGAKHVAAEEYVIIASTGGGKYGKSRIDITPTHYSEATITN